MLAVHLTAPFRLIQAATPYMRDAAKAEMQKHGKAAPRSIINVSSTSGTHGNAGQVNYATVSATTPRHMQLQHVGGSVCGMVFVATNTS